MFQGVRREYNNNSDYDVIDLTQIDDNYHVRVKYSPAKNVKLYTDAVPKTSWNRYDENYRLCNREMIGTTSERSLTAAILPPGVGHVITVFGWTVKDLSLIAKMAGCYASLPYDFFVKTIGKGHVCTDTTMLFPIVSGKYDDAIIVRALRLNCLTNDYAALWKENYKTSFISETFVKKDKRLELHPFANLKDEWTKDIGLYSDYERRQALVELDILVAMSLGMTLDQLISIYKIQFPVLQSYEEDTWYDSNGRIVFTNNRSLTGVGLSRAEFEAIKDMKSGIYSNIVSDDTMPEGPKDRVIEYCAPFDRCVRELDYKEAWDFFEKRFVQ